MAETAAAEQLTSSLLHSSSSGNNLHQTALEFRSPAITTDPVRIGNTLQRTTSETLRLTEPTLLLQTQFQPQLQQQVQQQLQEPLQPQTVISTLSDGSVLDAKKTSSFQITSVISSSVSNDGEDDSCGEVEDCQTDVSEVGSQRQIQYEMILDTGMYMNDGDSGLSVTSIGVPVSIAQQASEGSGIKVEDKDHGWQGRFRVVKIESSEPFKRGRWLCMDFLDPPSIQPSLSKEEPGSGASSSASISDHILVHEDTGQSSQIHPQPPPGLQQSVSTVAPAAQPANPQQLNNNGVHLATHSLSGSAAPASYSSSQQPSIQPVYQQSTTIPVYPVTSMAMMPPMSMQAPAHSVQSLTMPILPPQPTVSPAAVVTMSALPSGVGASYVQQPASTALHNTGQQSVPPSSISMIQASTYSTSTVVGAQQYVAPSQSLQGIQSMTLPQQIVPQALPQPQIASTPPQPIPLPQQSSTNSSVPVSHVIPGSILIQPQQPSIVQAPQQQQPSAPLIQPGTTVQHPVAHQTGTGHSGGMVPVMAQPGSVQQQQSVPASMSVPVPVPGSTSMSAPVSAPIVVPVSMPLSMPMPISGPVTTFSQAGVPSGSTHQPGLMVSQATSVQQGPTTVSLPTGMFQHPIASVQGGSLQLGGPPIQPGGIISQQQHSGLSQAQAVGVIHHQPISSIAQLGGSIQPPVSSSQHPLPIQPTSQLVTPSGGGTMTSSGSMPQSATLLQHPVALQQQQPSSAASQSTQVVQQTATGSVPAVATSIQTNSSVLQNTMATTTLHAPGQSSGLMQSAPIQQVNNVSQTQPQQQPPLMQQQALPQQMQPIGSIQQQQQIIPQQPQPSPIQQQPLQQSQQQQSQQTLQQQPLQQSLQQQPTQAIQQPLQQSMPQAGSISQQPPVQQMMPIQQPQQPQQPSPSMIQQPIQQPLPVQQQSPNVLQQAPLQSSMQQQQQHLGVAQPSAGNLQHTPMQQSQQQQQQSAPVSMSGLPVYMSQANFPTVSTPPFAAQTNQIPPSKPIVPHQPHQQPATQQLSQSTQPQHSTQASADESAHPPPGDDHSSASGSSTVAIDNKIEQAMDLVKSHLMFAVREEVEVLKEKIAELMERIAFLESENSILRAAASQETLSQLSQIEPPFPATATDSSSGCGSASAQGQNGASAP